MSRTEYSLGSNILLYLDQQEIHCKKNKYLGVAATTVFFFLLFSFFFSVATNIGAVQWDAGLVFD